MANLAYQHLCHVELDAIDRVLALDQQADDVLEEGAAMLYKDKQSGITVRVTVCTVHSDHTPPSYSIRLPSGQERETLRERLRRDPMDDEPTPQNADEALPVHVLRRLVGQQRLEAQAARASYRPEGEPFFLEAGDELEVPQPRTYTPLHLHTCANPHTHCTHRTHTCVHTCT